MPQFKTRTIHDFFRVSQATSARKRSLQESESGQDQKSAQCRVVVVSGNDGKISEEKRKEASIPSSGAGHGFIDGDSSKIKAIEAIEAIKVTDQSSQELHVQESTVRSHDVSKRTSPTLPSEKAVIQTPIEAECTSQLMTSSPYLIPAETTGSGVENDGSARKDVRSGLSKESPTPSTALADIDVASLQHKPSKLPTIRNSDGESDDELADIDQIIGRPLKPLHNPQETYPGFYQGTEYPAVYNGKDEKSKRRCRPSISLLKLAEQRRAFEDTEEAVAQVNAVMEQQRQQAKVQNDSMVVGSKLVDNVLASTGNSENMDRLKSALQRTEAMFYDETWAFFEPSSRIASHDAASLSSKFRKIPKIPAISDEVYGPLLHESSAEYSFRSGIVGELARWRRPSSDLTRWLLIAACSEADENLREMYRSALRRDSQQVAAMLTLDQVDDLFRGIGALPDSLRLDTPIVPQRAMHEDMSKGASIWWDVECLILVIGDVAALLTDTSRLHVLKVLIRLLLDRTVVLQRSLLLTVQSVLVNLLEQRSGTADNEAMKDRLAFFEKLLDYLYYLTTSPSIRAQLLRNLPQTSSVWHHLTRRLALAFYFESSDWLRLVANPVVFRLETIMERLAEHPAFRISATTDYANLTALLVTLDMAIDDADCPDFSPSSSSSPHHHQSRLGDEPLQVHDKSHPLFWLGSSLEEPGMAYSKPTEKTEKQFNNTIDSLASSIKSMFMAIIDTGASNMRRTEAKEVLEACHSRLLYAVRTKPPPMKRFVFGGGDEDRDILAMKKGMDFFLGIERDKEVGSKTIGENG